MNKILTAFLLLVLTGCAALTTIASNPIIQTGVKWGIINMLSDQPEKRSDILYVVHQLQRYSDQKAVVTIYELEDYTLELIPWDKMSKANQVIALDLVSYSSDYLREMVGEGELSGNEKIRIQDFLNWIEQVVRFAG